MSDETTAGGSTAFSIERTPGKVILICCFNLLFKEKNDDRKDKEMGNLRNQVSKLTKENKKLESNRKREVLKLKSTCAKLKKLHKESLTVY